MNYTENGRRALDKYLIQPLAEELIRNINDSFFNYGINSFPDLKKMGINMEELV